MAINMPSASASGAKWASVTPGRGAYYTAGVQNAGPRWQAGVDTAQDNYNQGVQQAVARGGYASGVAGKGQKYATRAAQIGAGRWQTGVGQGATAYEQGVQPVVAALQGLTLPPRQSKGSPANLARVQAVIEAERRAVGKM